MSMTCSIVFLFSAASVVTRSCCLQEEPATALEGPTAAQTETETETVTDIAIDTASEQYLQDAALPSHSGALLSPEAIVGCYVHVEGHGAGVRKTALTLL